MKITEAEADKLSNLFFNHKNKNNKTLSLHERGLQQYWYNKCNFPFEPYYDIQYIGFDTDPKTFQDVFINQQKLITDFFKTSGWILKIIKG